MIWLDLPFPVNLYRSLKRAVQRVASGQNLWPDSNNQESLRQMFGKDSIVWWMVKTHGQNRKKYTRMMQSPEYQHIRWIRLRTAKEAQRFLDALPG